MLVSKSAEISHATIKPLVDFSSIMPAWRALESKLSPPFFLTWDWVVAAIGKQPLNLFLAQLFDEDGVLAGLEHDAKKWIPVFCEYHATNKNLEQNADSDLTHFALVILCRVIETRNRFVRSTQLRLQEFGTASNAMIPIEYTTMLIHPETEKSGWLALLKALTEPGAPDWDEFVVTNAVAKIEKSFVVAGASVHRRTKNPSAHVDLKALREAGAQSLEDFLECVSRNTRSQIKHLYWNLQPSIRCES